MKFRKGDKVSAIGVVGYTYEGQTLIPVRFGDGSETHLRAGEIAALVERKFEVGELVHVGSDERRSWEVVAIDGPMLWLKLGGERLTAAAERCSLAEPDPELVDWDESPLPPPDPPRSGLDDEPVNQAPGKCITVKPGDTLGVLALVHGTDVDTLVRLNKIKDPDVIEVGQVLELPR